MESMSCPQCICSNPSMQPPEPPIFDSTSKKARDEMMRMQTECEVYQQYIELCGGNRTFIPASSKISSTPAQTTVVSRVTTLQDVTTEFTNVTSFQNDTLVPPTSILNNSSQDSNDWVVPVVIVLILAIFLAISAVVIYLYKRKGKEGFRKSVMYQNLSHCFFWNDPQAQRNRKASLSSVESKKSGSSVGEIRLNGKIDTVVFAKQLSSDEKDFKHSSTAQLIDEPPAHVVVEYYNPATESGDVHLNFYESSDIGSTQNNKPDTQTHYDVIEEGRTQSDTNQKEKDSDVKADTDVYINTETSLLQTMSKPTTEAKSESFDNQREKDYNNIKPSTEDTESVCIKERAPETEESLSNLKSQFNIDLNSNTAVDGKSSIQNQMSVDSGYESHINSPQQECV